MKYTWGEIPTKLDEIYMIYNIHGVGYTWSGIYIESRIYIGWDTHEVGYTRDGIYTKTEWDTHRVRYTQEVEYK